MSQANFEKSLALDEEAIAILSKPDMTEEDERRLGEIYRELQDLKK